ncbi:hypothetical protein KC963_01660 [Candidatus Saccharibacteria bacterium]|nr:hypothetical protein [Candidatus Saccharibacteria bacterium]
MITTNIGAEQLFEDPEFGLKLTEWQRTRILYSEHTRAFVRAVQNDFPSKEGPITTADYICEIPIHELVDTDYYKDLFMLSDTAHDLADARLKAADENAAAKEQLVQRGQAVGTNQFALYGLGRVLHLETSHISGPALLERVRTVEDKLAQVDRFIREHGGEVITILGPYCSEVTAARIAGEGLALVSNRRASTPLVDGYQAHTSARIFGKLHRYTEDVLSLDPDKITLYNNVMVKPVDLLKPESFSGHEHGLAIAAGEMVEGPPEITRGRDVGYFTDILNQARYVTQLAALPSA